MILVGRENIRKFLYFLSIDKAKFRKPVSPGDKLDYFIAILSKHGDILTIESKVNNIVSEAELKAVVRKYIDYCSLSLQLVKK